MWKQPPRGFGEFALHRHAPPAPDQAQGGLQPRPVLANWQLFSGWPYRAGHTGLGFHIGGKAAALASEEVLRHFANGVVAAGVSLLLCQKLVAPTLLPLSKARPHQGYILARMAPSRLHQRQRMPGRHLGAASLGHSASWAALMLPCHTGLVFDLGCSGCSPSATCWCYHGSRCDTSAPPRRSAVRRRWRSSSRLRWAS